MVTRLTCKNADGAIRSSDLFQYLVAVKHGSLVSRIATWIFAVSFLIFSYTRIELMTNTDEVTTLREQFPTASNYELQVCVFVGDETDNKKNKQTNKQQVPTFGVTFNNGRGGRFNDTYLTVKFELRDIYAADEKASTRQSLGSESCYLPHQQTYGWCPSSNATVMGTFGDPDYRFIEIAFNVCSGKTSSGEACAPPEEIRRIFTEGGVSIDVWSFRSLGWSSWETLYLSVHPDIIQMVEIFLSPVTVREVAQYPWEFDKKQTHITRQSYYTRFSESASGTALLKAILRISSSSIRDTVRRVRLLDVLTEVAAVWTVSVSGIGALLVFYNFVHWRKWYAGRYPWQVQYHYLPAPPAGAPEVVEPKAGLAKHNKSWSWMRRKTFKEMETTNGLDEGIELTPIHSTVESQNSEVHHARWGVRRLSLPPDRNHFNQFPTRVRASSLTPPRPRAGSSLTPI